MKRFLTAAVLIAFAAPLAGCGISGGLKTPPPIWGDAKADDTATTSDADTDASTTASDDLRDAPVENEIGYGVDVADTP